MENDEVKRSRGRPLKTPGKSSKDKDVTKEYQKNYYQKNRAKLLEQSKANSKIKVKCDLCHKSIAKGNLSLHQSTELCKKKRNRIKNLFQDLKELTDLMNLDSNGYDKLIQKYA